MENHNTEPPDQQSAIAPHPLASSCPSPELTEILFLLKTRGAGSETSSSLGILDLFKKAAEISLVLGVFLYVVGWSYLFAYYRAFGLDLRQLGISLEEAMIFSTAALFADPTVVAMLAAIAVVFAFLPALEKRTPRVSALLFLFAMFALYGAASWRASNVGHDMAMRHASEGDGTLPSVSILIDPKKLPDANDRYPGLTEGGYRLLIQTTDAIWIFKPVPPNSKGPTKIHMIPAGAVSALNLVRYLNN